MTGVDLVLQPMEPYEVWRADTADRARPTGAELAQVLVATLRAEKARSLSRLILLRGAAERQAHFGLFLG